MMLYNYNITSIIIFLFFILNVIAFCKINTARNNKKIKELKDTDIYIAETLKKIKSGILKEEKKINKSIKIIKYKQHLKKIPFNSPYDVDNKGICFNTRIKSDFDGFCAVSYIKKDSYIEPIVHDTCQQIKCVKGSFFDNKTDKWYEPGEFLIIPAFCENEPLKHWHDIETGRDGAELLIFLMPK